MDLFTAGCVVKKIINAETGHLLPGNCEVNHHGVGRGCSGFVYILSGEAIYYFSDKTVTAEQGSVLFLSKHSIYKIRVTSADYRFAVVNFDFFEEERMPLDNEAIIGRHTEPLKSAFLKICQSFKTDTRHEQPQYFALLYDIYDGVCKDQSTRYVPKSKSTQIAAAVDIMANNFTNPEFSVEDLGNRCGLSKVHFRRVFGQIYHMSPVRYLTLLRLGKAKELLLGAETPIGEIAIACGYRNAYYFSKIFHAEFGMTPREYRKSHGNFL